MRILYGTATFYPEENGVSTFLQHIAPAMKKRGHEVEIICPSRTRKTEKREFMDIPVFAPKSVSLPMNRQFRLCVSPVLQRTIKKEVERFQPDVIHVQDPFTINLALTYTAKKEGIPIIGTHHTDINLYQEYFPVVPDKILDKVASVEWMLLCWFLSQMDAVTSPTKAAAEPLKEHGLQAEVQAISNGILLEQFDVPKDRSVLSEFSIPDVPIILSVGRLDPEKNVDTVICAFAKTLPNAPAHLVVVGRGTQLKKLEKLVSKLGITQHVTFAGFVPNESLPQLYAAGDVFVSAGHAETQSLVTLEAMASGLPVVAANALALPELVRDGENGFLFENQNEDQLADCIQKLLTDAGLRKTMGDASRLKAAEHDKKHTIEAFEKLYESVLYQSTN